MILLGQPWWLLGLGAAPLIWWLHRAAGHGRSIVVANLLLFRDAQHRASAGAPSKRADPAWRRRALAACALSLALADIAIPLRSRDVTVWLDDTLSMGTREANGTRLQLAWQQLRALREREQLATLDIRSLTQPGRSYSLDGAPPVALDVAPQPPPAGALRRDRVHWLVTDGASPAINRWALTSGLQRRMQIGAARDNVAVTRLAARPSLRTPGQYIIDVEVRNAGFSATARELVLRSDSTVLVRRSLQLAAAATQRLQFAAPLASAAWSAQLLPADALAADDRLDLPAATLRPVAFELDPRCPASVATALRAHPGLRVASLGAAADMAIACGAATASAALPTLQLLAADTVPSQATTAVWTADARSALSSVSLPSLLLARGVLSAAGDGSQTMLQSGSGALVRRSRAAPYRVVASLDLGSRAMAGEPEYAMLIAQLVDLTLDRAWVSPLAAQARSAEESRIAPWAGAASDSSVQADPGRRSFNLTWLLLALAALAMLWDLANSWRERRTA